MKSVRRRLTYANVMSSIAVFLVVAGGSAFAASTLGKNTVGTKQLKNNAVTTAKIKNGAVTGAKIGSGAVGASNINTAGLTVPNATHADSATKAETATKAGSAGTADTANNALALGGKGPSSYYEKSEILWAVVSFNGTLVQGSGAISSTLVSAGRFQVTFNRNVEACTSIGSQVDAGGGEPPAGTDARIVATDNVSQEGEETKVNVTTTNPAGAQESPAGGDGIQVTVIC
ncbi:MAG TPA: hypothetical protein VH299_02445 [Solirubrobacterales bacterium]|nr:hypothetical protein [Solirubrobacterales bacterium]